MTGFAVVSSTRLCTWRWFGNTGDTGSKSVKQESLNHSRTRRYKTLNSFGISPLSKVQTYRVFFFYVSKLILNKIFPNEDIEVKSFAYCCVKSAVLLHIFRLNAGCLVFLFYTLKKKASISIAYHSIQ